MCSWGGLYIIEQAIRANQIMTSVVAFLGQSLMPMISSMALKLHIINSIRKYICPKTTDFLSATQGKNQALAEAGAIVPDSFEAFEGAIAKTFKRLVDEKVITPQPNVEAATIPMDLEAAKKAGKVSVSSHICPWLTRRRSKQWVQRYTKCMLKTESYCKILCINIVTDRTMDSKCLCSASCHSACMSLRS